MKTELVTTLKRQATKILAELHETKEPVLITEHGRPSAYLVDPSDYEMMQRRLNIMMALTKGEKAIAHGQVYTHTQVVEKLKKKWQI